jgi:hypothetical protein
MVLGGEPKSFIGHPHLKALVNQRFRWRLSFNY